MDYSLGKLTFVDTPDVIEDGAVMEGKVGEVVISADANTSATYAYSVYNPRLYILRLVIFSTTFRQN